MLAKNLQTEFKKRGPWVTKFVIDGRAYGGRFDALTDGRLSQFFQQFPEAHTILELGSLEGGHTIGLARFPGVQRVLGLEGRPANLDRAKFVQTLLGVSQVDFVLENLETADLSRFGKFDAVFCVGVLYHLPRPWELIAQIAQVSSRLFIWTHYAPDKKARKTIDGFRGMEYREFGLRDPLSGLSPNSFWPTLDALRAILTGQGFKTIQIIEDNQRHPHGPAITLAATAPRPTNPLSQSPSGDSTSSIGSSSDQQLREAPAPGVIDFTPGSGYSSLHERRPGLAFKTIP